MREKHTSNAQMVTSEHQADVDMWKKSSMIVGWAARIIRKSILAQCPTILNETVHEDSAKNMAVMHQTRVEWPDGNECSTNRLSVLWCGGRSRLNVIFMLMMATTSTCQCPMRSEYRCAYRESSQPNRKNSQDCKWRSKRTQSWSISRHHRESQQSKATPPVKSPSETTYKIHHKRQRSQQVDAPWQMDEATTGKTHRMPSPV